MGRVLSEDTTIILCVSYVKSSSLMLFMPMVVNTEFSAFTDPVGGSSLAHVRRLDPGSGLDQ